MYKIILCCESDLEAINLLRKIFAKTLKPYLNMITLFVFTGEFSDPFNEFFIEKLMRRGGDNNKSLDFIYKMTSEPDIKIPVFLVSIAPSIFKAGTSVHLLKRGGTMEGVD